MKKDKLLTLMVRGYDWKKDMLWATEDEIAWLRVLEYKPIKEIK